MTKSSDRPGVGIEARLDDPSFYLEDPHPTYALLRSEAPVYWCRSGAFWALSKHEDIVWAESQGNPPLTATQGLFLSEAAQPARIADRDPTGVQQAGATFMSDPPSLTLFRRQVGGAFTEKRLTGLAAKVRAIAVELLDAIPLGEPVNMVEALSIPLAIRVAGEFLGVPAGDWELLRRWADAHRLIIGGGLDEGAPAMTQAIQDERDMYDYFARGIASRVDNPTGDLMSIVAEMDSNGERLAEDAQVMVCVAFLVAGTDATRNVLSGGMETFAQFPDEWRRLIEDPSLVRGATEELLRWVTPVLHFGRRATQPFVLRGVEIDEGEFIVLLYESGNRDEAVWKDPYRFDIGRPAEDRHHLSFGWGLHRCIGTALGRTEIDTVLEELRRRFSGWELASPPVRSPSTVVRDYQEVSVVLRRL